MSKKDKKDKKPEVVETTTKVVTDGSEEPVIEWDLSLSKEDIIAIKVSELETALAAKKEQLNELLKENSHAQCELRKEIADSVTAHVKDQLEERTNAFGQELLEMGLKVETNYSFTHSDSKITYSIQARAKDNQGRSPKETLKGSLSLHGKLEHSKETVTLQGKLEGLVEEHADLTEKMLETRKRLQELPRTEREARAALAKTILQRTERGQNLLAGLSGNLNLHLPLLDVQE